MFGASQCSGLPICRADLPFAWQVELILLPILGVSTTTINAVGIHAGGTIGEFVNPKYKDASKTAFKSSTRLECMMQDYPQALPADARVGFTVINQVGLNPNLLEH